MQNIGETKINILKRQFTKMCGIITWKIEITLEME